MTTATEQNRKLHTTNLLCIKPWKVIKTNNLFNLDFCECWLNLKIVNLAKKKNLNDNPQKWRKPRNFVKYNEKSEILRIIWNTLGLEHTKIISNYWSLLPTLRKVWIFIHNAAAYHVSWKINSELKNIFLWRIICRTSTYNRNLRVLLSIISFNSSNTQFYESRIPISPI